MNALPDPTSRGLITGSTMLAAVLVTLDATIANVALPHIQSSVAASPEQIVWVITSYVIAGAIATPLSGWLATRFGLHAIDAVHEGKWGQMTALRGTDIVTVPLSEATKELKLVDPELYAEAAVFFG